MSGDQNQSVVQKIPEVKYNQTLQSIPHILRSTIHLVIVADPEAEKVEFMVLMDVLHWVAVGIVVVRAIHQL
jgi:hypothetical protein